MAKKQQKAAPKKSAKKIPKGATVIDVPKKNIEKQKAVYSCILCKEIFKDPSLCPNCDVVLKKKAS